MPEISRRLFVITASNEQAKQNVQKTIAKPVDPAICAAHFPAEVLDEVSRKSADGNFYAWGALPGKRNEPNWNTLQEGDYVFLYQDGNYTFWMRVISKHRNRAFAEAVWKLHPEGNTWEFMYFVQPPVPLQCPAHQLGDFLLSQPQGFAPISIEKVQNIISKYGSIEKFIEERMESPGTYLLLRSNEGSGWSDKEGHSYHYGNTVPNHTAVVRGTKFLVDRVDRDGRRIFGTGTIGAIDEEPGSGKATKAFRAMYDQYRSLRPPRLLTKEEESLLTSLQAYNIQHSIHRITSEVFERLGKPATAWIFQANPALYNLRGALQALDVDTFVVTRYENEIKTGHRVYLWESGNAAGIVGVANVIEDPSPRPELPASHPFQLDPANLGGTKVRALLRHVRVVDPTISREQIQSLPTLSNLSILKQPFASNFKVTQAEAEAIEDLLDQKTEPGKKITSESIGVNENSEIPKNLILCGPPGTGKTYHTVDKALEVLESEYFATHKDDRENLKKRFDEHIRAGRIEFVTFHQSFSYEDFVEGIRAEATPEGQILYDVQDGVFKDLCDRARRATAQGGDLGINETPRMWKISIDRTGSRTVRDHCLSNGEARIGWRDVGDLRSLEGAENGEFQKLGPNDKSSLMSFYEDIVDAP